MPVDLQSTLDILPISVVLLLSFGIMVIAIEIGYKLGNGILSAGVKAQLAQVRAIMGASLGLLAFMLAFSFSIAQSHFEQRTDAYTQEVSSIRSAYISAGLLQQSERVEARQLLQEFVAGRLSVTSAVRENKLDEVLRQIQLGEIIHTKLWHLAERDSGFESSNHSDLFAQAVVAMIDANGSRKQSTIYNRVSVVIWLTLMFMSVLGMLIMGFQAGLTGAPSRLATWSLALTFAVVMTLVTDLDRPRMSLFSMNQQQMEELHELIRTDMQAENGLGNRPLKTQ
jgi:hypothetical protein